MFLKRRVRHKDGKDHIYYSVCESLRVHSGRVIQRQVLHLGEPRPLARGRDRLPTGSPQGEPAGRRRVSQLNTTQIESWQRTLEVIDGDDGGRRLQRRLFADREGAAPAADDVIELRLSSLRVREPRRFGDCWAGCRLWQELGLDAFWQQRLGSQRGEVPWAKVLELLAVNRLLDPRSELFVHEKWFPQTAMDVLLDCDFAVAHKDRLYRCLDRIVEHKGALEQHLAAKWSRAQQDRQPTGCPAGVSAANQRPLRRELRYHPLRSDEHLLRGQRRGCRQGKERLLARPPPGLQAAGYRAGRHRRGLSTDL
jgi:hypothetical protein